MIKINTKLPDGCLPPIPIDLNTPLQEHRLNQKSQMHFAGNELMITIYNGDDIRIAKFPLTQVIEGFKKNNLI